MTAVFFDLETSRKENIGAILNYCFIAVSDDLNSEEELAGDIRLSGLELPSPGALLANRVDILRHQATVQDDEYEAVVKIKDFIEGVLSRAKRKVPLVGYNSNRFDVPFLRTTFIRNGFSPYFGGGVVYRDLLQASRRLAASESSFPRLANPEDKGRLSLRLETLCHGFGLLTGAQTHTSSDDVALTIELARVYREQFDLDILGFQGYEGTPWHDPRERGTVCAQILPDYDLSSSSHVERRPVVLLDNDNRGALWIDLLDFKEGGGEQSIRWFNQSTGELFLERQSDLEAEYGTLASKALNELGGVTLQNFFTVSSCDIEQDIYRIDFGSLELLNAMISEGAPRSPKLSQDAATLLTRYKLRRVDWSNSPDLRALELLKSYAKYRYGGSLQLSKSADSESVRYHETLQDILKEISDRLSDASAKDRAILESLRAFVEESAIYRAAGRELLS